MPPLIPTTRHSLFDLAREPATRNTALTRFVALYQPVILNWIRRRTAQHADAEDVAQAVLTRLVSTLADYDPEKGRFRSWLQAVVHNAVSDFYRARAARRDAVAEGGDSFKNLLDTLPSPESVGDLDAALGTASACDPLMLSAVESVRAAVTPAAWQAFEQMYRAEFTAKEIADQLGMKVGAVYQAKYRVRQLLKEAYEGLLPESSRGSDG